MKFLVLLLVLSSFSVFAQKTCYDNKQVNMMDVVSKPMHPKRYISENLKVLKAKGDVKSHKMEVSFSGTAVNGGKEEVEIFNYGTDSGTSVAKFNYGNNDYYVIKNDVTGCTSMYKYVNKNELQLVMDYPDKDAMLGYFKGGAKVADYKDENLNVEEDSVKRKVFCVSVGDLEKMDYKGTKICKHKMVCEAYTKSHKDNALESDNEKVFTMMCNCEKYDESQEACFNQYVDKIDDVKEHYKNHSDDLKFVDGVSNQ
jgi:hypothetical protein